MSHVLGQTLFWIFTVLYVAIWARVIVSWLPMLGLSLDPYNPLIKILYDITDPILVPLRRFTTIGAIDLSPLAAIIIIGLLRNVFRVF